MNQKELLQQLAEQDKQIAHQNEQIRVMKQALLRLEQRLGKVALIAERAQGNNQRLSERLRIAEARLIQS